MGGKRGVRRRAERQRAANGSIQGAPSGWPDTRRPQSAAKKKREAGQGGDKVEQILAEPRRFLVLVLDRRKLGRRGTRKDETRELALNPPRLSSQQAQVSNLGQ